MLSLGCFKKNMTPNFTPQEPNMEGSSTRELSGQESMDPGVFFSDDDTSKFPNDKP